MGFAETFKALADPVRRDILTMLKEGRKSAGEIGSHFDMTGATISYHLNILKKAELVTETKEKNYVFYELNTSVVEDVMVWLSELRGETDDEKRKTHDNNYKPCDTNAIDNRAVSIEQAT